MKRTPIKRVSSALQKRKRAYSKIAAEYLETHWLCQASLLEKCIPESHALVHAETCSGGALVEFKSLRYFIPESTEIHHRNKRNGIRLTDSRWFMAISRVQHDWIENNLREARAIGWLLDISANPDGITPGGQQGLTTEQLFAKIEA